MMSKNKSSGPIYFGLNKTFFQIFNSFFCLLSKNSSNEDQTLERKTSSLTKFISGQYNCFRLNIRFSQQIKEKSHQTVSPFSSVSLVKHLKCNSLNY